MRDGEDVVMNGMAKLQDELGKCTLVVTQSWDGSGGGRQDIQKQAFGRVFFIFDFLIAFLSEIFTPYTLP